MSKIKLLNGNIEELCDLLDSYGMIYLLKTDSILVRNEDLDRAEEIMYEHGYEWTLDSVIQPQSA